MARARNIKPSIFRNEILGTIDPLITLLFESLWCLADRDGKLEDRPLRIKADTFPYRENIDINGYLTVLAQHGFIKRYSVAGVAIIQVSKFKEHQSPHNTERASVLPDEKAQVIENKQETTLTVNPPLKDAGLTASLPPESISLIPDSLIPDSLIPDSLIPECGKKERESSAKAPRPAKKCPADFAITPEMGQWAKDHDVTVDLQTETEKFKDYTFPRTISDWLGAWRNWLRKAQEFADKNKLTASNRTDPPEPAWRREQRERTANAVPGIAAKTSFDKQFIEVEARHVTAITLG